MGSRLCEYDDDNDQMNTGYLDKNYNLASTFSQHEAFQTQRRLQMSSQIQTQIVLCAGLDIDLILTSGRHFIHESMNLISVSAFSAALSNILR